MIISFRKVLHWRFLMLTLIHLICQILNLKISHLWRIVSIALLLWNIHHSTTLTQNKEIWWLLKVDEQRLWWSWSLAYEIQFWNRLECHWKWKCHWRSNHVKLQSCRSICKESHTFLRPVVQPTGFSPNYVYAGLETMVCSINILFVYFWSRLVFLMESD